VSEPEPLRVRVARALGWRDIPNYPADGEWVLRTIEQNGLDLTRPEEGQGWVASQVGGGYGEAATPGDAVGEWVVAATAAGIEVRQ